MENLVKACNNIYYMSICYNINDRAATIDKKITKKLHRIKS